MKTFNFALAAMCIVGWGQFAAGQSTTKPYSGTNLDSNINSPSSTLGGYTGTALSGIYRNSVGFGHTSQSLRSLVSNADNFNLGNIGQSRVAMGQIGRRPASATSAAPRLPTFNTGGGSNTAKPFATATPSPTVSPYLSLFSDSLDDAVLPNYTTRVRPQLQQQAFNQNLQRQQQVLERRLQQVSAQPAYNPQGSRSLFPTGHQTVFNYTSHFYPSARRRR